MGKNPALLYVTLHTFGETSFNFNFRTHFFNSKCLIWVWHLCDFWLCGRFCFHVHNSNALFQLIIAQSRVLPYSCLQQSLLGSSKHHHLTRPFIFKMLTCTVIGYKWMSVPSEWLKKKNEFFWKMTNELYLPTWPQTPTSSMVKVVTGAPLTQPFYYRFLAEAPDG